MAKRLQTYRSGALAVTFDPTRCIHAAACIRALPAVFDSKARPWVRPEAATRDEIVNAVHRCPSGALRVLELDQRIEAEREPVSVQVTRNGPLIVRGEVRVLADDGTELVRDTQIALCRCGQSEQKPFCDNSHRRVGFRDPAD